LQVLLLWLPLSKLAWHRSYFFSAVLFGTSLDVSECRKSLKVGDLCVFGLSHKWSSFIDLFLLVFAFLEGLYWQNFAGFVIGEYFGLATDAIEVKLQGLR
jgi:hypothetical protein